MANNLNSIHLGQVINDIIHLNIKRVTCKHILYSLVAQPNGNKKENCLTAFKPNNDTRPMWYDRSCIENYATYKFMCECNIPGKQTIFLL